jgi:hypothetical protein
MGRLDGAFRWSDSMAHLDGATRWNVSMGRLEGASRWGNSMDCLNGATQWRVMSALYQMSGPKVQSPKFAKHTESEEAIVHCLLFSV